jgi:hypothetical protein
MVTEPLRKAKEMKRLPNQEHGCRCGFCHASSTALSVVFVAPSLFQKGTATWAQSPWHTAEYQDRQQRSRDCAAHARRPVDDAVASE